MIAGRRKVEEVAHIQLEFPVQVQVGPEQRAQAASVLVGQFLPPLRVGQDDLDHDGVEVGDRGLDQVQRQRGDLDVLFVITGELAGLAVEDVFVGAVPVLHDVEAFVDLSAQFLAGQVVTDEDGAHDSAEFLDGLVGGVFGATAGEAAQHLVGLGGAQAQRGRVFVFQGRVQPGQRAGVALLEVGDERLRVAGLG